MTEEQKQRENIRRALEDVRRAIYCADALLEHDGAATKASIKLLLETSRALGVEAIAYLVNWAEDEE